MGFFDLNIPYETFQSSKTTRIKLVIKAMELGYTGVAYNHIINGVMSDNDRCSIAPFSLSSLLNFAPSLVSSVNFHRDLLGIPRFSPFRQYTRLTVCVDTPAKSQALNSGNPILKTYDLVAVRPLNQIAFDHACEKSEVDIIAIDFSEKMSFRLKQSVVKAAIERGVYFEISYSDLIVDVQVRRQMISNAKLLVDWTRGRNLIFSSAAPSVSRLRGPYDVANLSSLLGLSNERAKAAISKNCRNLIANALKKKHFYKEAIRVELMPSYGNSDPEESLSLDWLKWDPISSGEGDLQLEDVAKFFSAAAGVSSSVKAIDCASVIDCIPSLGGNLVTVFKTVDVPVATSGMSEKIGRHDLPETDFNSLCNFLSKNQSFDHGSAKVAHFPGNTAKASNSGEFRSAADTTEEAKNSNVSDALLPFLVTQEHDLQSQKQTPCEINAILPNEDTICQASAMDIGLAAAFDSDNKVENLSEDFNFHTPLSEKNASSEGLDAVPGVQNVLVDRYATDMVIEDQEDTPVTENAADMGLEDQEDTPVTENVPDDELRESGEVTTRPDLVSFRSPSGDMKVEDFSSITNQDTLKEVAMQEQERGNANLETSIEVAIEEWEHEDANWEIQEEVAVERQGYGDPNVQTPEEVVMDDQELGGVDTESVVGQENYLKVNYNKSGANFISLDEVALKKEKCEEAGTESNHPAVLQSLQGKSRAKRHTLSQPLIFPLRRLLNPIPFKRKSKKFKRNGA